MESDKEKLSLAHKISILNERQIAFSDQQKRFFSHIESEQRHFKTQGVLISKIEHNMQLQSELLKKDIEHNSEILAELKAMFVRHETTLVNGGRGLIFEVDRLKQRAEHNREGRAVIIAMIGVGISVLGFIIDHLHIFSK